MLQKRFKSDTFGNAKVAREGKETKEEKKEIKEEIKEIQEIKSGKIETVPLLFSRAILPALPLISLYLTSEDYNAVTSVNKIFNSFYKNNLIWRDLYREHWGETFFHEDYKAQYIAAFLWHEASTFISTKRFKQLDEHIKTHDTKSWTLIFKAALAREGIIKDRNPYLYALEALRLGDTRAIGFLTMHLKALVFSGGAISSEHFIEILNLFLQYNTNAQFTQEICLHYGFLFKSLKKVEDKINNKEQALVYFFRGLYALDHDVKSFVIFFIDALKLLHIIDEETGQKLRDDESLLNKPNVLEAMMYCNELKLLAEVEYTFNWVKDLADHGIAEAAFHYAHHIRLNPKLSMEAKKYFIQALKGNDYRAASDLRNLSIKHSDVISKTEVIDHLTPGAVAGDHQCIIALGREFRALKNWHKDLFKVWILQLTVCVDIVPRYNYGLMLKKAENPEGYYVRCALLFIHALRDKNMKKVEEDFLFLTSVDPELLDRYLEAGKKYGLCKTEHEQVINRLRKIEIDSPVKGLPASTQSESESKEMKPWR